MNPVSRSPARRALLRTALFGIGLCLSAAGAQEAVPPAKELAARLTANVQDGSSTVRLKMEIQPPAGGARSVLQLQVKSRRTKAATDLLYQVLWPKERKGESILLRKGADRSTVGKVFVPPASLQTLTASQMREGVFGSDLSYEDLIENFFAWDNQTIAGSEVVDRVPCQILESKPAAGDRSSYGKVRSWIDVKRLVPLRIEKYLASGQMVRRITTTRVAKDDAGRLVPASLSVQGPGPGSVTEIEGSKSRYDVVFQDSDFTPEAVQKPVSPGSTGK